MLLFTVNKCRLVDNVVWHIMISPQALNHKNHLKKLKEKSTLQWIIADVSGSVLYFEDFWLHDFLFSGKCCSIGVMVTWSTYALKLMAGCSKFRHILKGTFKEITKWSGRRLSQVEEEWIQPKVTVQDFITVLAVGLADRGISFKWHMMANFHCSFTFSLLVPICISFCCVSEPNDTNLAKINFWEFLVPVLEPDVTKYNVLVMHSN